MTITAPERTDLIKIAVGLFNAAPGATYLSAFVPFAGNTDGLVGALVADPAFTAIYPTYLTSAEFAAKFVNTLVGSATVDATVEQNAKDWIAGRLDAGESRAAVLADVLAQLDGVTDGEGDWGQVATQFHNKVKVAEYYSVIQAGNATDLTSLKNVIKAVDASTDVSSDDALAAAIVSGGVDANVGKTYTLTQGLDTVVGSSGNDTINAYAFNSVTGADVTTLNSVDSIDGGAGNDTLFIEVKGAAAYNATLQGTIKNVETIKIDNTANTGAASAVDASLFQGATNITQISKAGNVTKLAAGTTATFKGITAGGQTVSAADAAATAVVALDGVDEGLTFNVNSTGALNSVTVSGAVVDAGAKDGVIAKTNINVTAGKDVESVAVNSAVATLLTVANAGGKTVSTVDASASAGAIDYQTAANTVANIKTGAGADKAKIIFAGTATANAASLSTGAGDDTLTVSVTQGAATAVTATVDAGDGNDTINLTVATGVTYTVAAGAGDDTVAISGTVKTTDKIDGGAGNDTVSLAAKASYVADDYIVFNKVLTNFETLALTGATAATLDAAQLAANYTTIDINSGSTVNNVGSQSLIANGSVVANAAGYKDAAGATPITYAGTLNITEKTSGSIQAHADTVNLTVQGGKDAAAVNASLTGEAKTATITLAPATDTKDTATATDDTFVASSVSLTQTATASSNNFADLTSLTLKGNGKATVHNDVAGNKLVTVDASALNSADVKGVAVTGLTYTSSNTSAETIKLGGGIDSVTLNASNYGKVDTVEGLNLVASAADAKVADFAKSDALILGNALHTTFKTFTTTQTDLDLALKDAAASAQDNLVFQLGGNTYVYVDAAAANGVIDATDTVVKLAGTVNLDLLISVLGHDYSPA